ncbi:MAG: EndoU domain-containing protein [Kordia sp.]|uniref:EndoU domain-containing protein n=1 Tax=Kordia sp. TaxID=1965332 RepID=UPI00385A4AD1
MKRIIMWLRNNWKIKKYKKNNIRKLLNHSFISIKIKRNTSIILSCWGSIGVTSGERQLFWKNVLVFSESKSKRYKSFLKDVIKNAKREGKSISQYMDELSDLIQKANLRRVAYNDFLTQITRSNLDELIEHIFEGHLRSTRIGRGARGRRTPSTKGIHSEDLLDNVKNRIKPGSRRPPNPLDDEVYKAHVQMKGTNGNWIDKYNSSGTIIDTTMFPKNWNKQRILEEVAFAFKNKMVDTNPIFFFGRTTNGIKIKFVIVNGEITTVFPLI